MNKKEAVLHAGLKKFPKKFDGVPTEKCIALVSRDWGEDDYAIYKNGKAICDKGFMHRIKAVKQYYYDIPKPVVKPEDKLAELQKMAALAEMEKKGQELEESKEVRPTERKAMQVFVKEHKLAEKSHLLSNVDLNLALDAYFI